jgi:predicted kinase
VFQAMRPRFIVVCGLPGTGKSTLSDAIAEQLQAPVLTKDRIEASLWRDGIKAEQNSWQIAENLLTTLAAEQLRRHQSVILDTVARSVTSRSSWRSLADELGARFRVIECVCGDEHVHRTRIESRDRGIPGWYELSWADVERVRRHYTNWTGEHLVLDAIRPLDENVTTALDYLDLKDRRVAP